MKKIFVVAGILSLLLSTTVFAEIERGVISTSTSINKEISPDTVEISVAVTSTDNNSLQAASNKNKDLTDKLYKTLKEMINPANGDYVKTSDYRAQPLYIYLNNKRNFDKYEVSNRITIHTKATNKVGEIIDKAVASGATNIDSLNFTAQYENQCDTLIIEATKSTKSKAEKYAQAAGTTITGVKSLNTSCSTSSNRVSNLMMAKAVYGNTDEASTPIESGTIRVNVTVNATYFVK